MSTQGKNPEVSNFVTAKETVCDLESTNIYSPTQEALIPRWRPFIAIIVLTVLVAETRVSGFRVARLRPDTTKSAMAM